MAVESTVIKHFTDGSMSFSDGTGSPVTLAVPFCVGDMSLSALTAVQRAETAYETRGVLNSVRLGARVYPTGSFSFQSAEYTDATLVTAQDYILKQGSFSANISTLLPTEVYAFDIIWTVEGTDLGDAADHVCTITDCRVTLDVGEGEPNTHTLSFTIYGTVTWS